MAILSFLTSSRARIVLLYLIFLHSASAYIGNATISSTVLIVARDGTSAENGAAAGLRGYGIPYEILTVPQSGVSALPVLNNSAIHGNYGSIVVLSEVGYNSGNSYSSALTRSQWNSLFDYQTQFGIRMVRLDVFPSAEFGVVSNGGRLDDDSVLLTNNSGFAQSSLRMNVGVSVANIFHYPATITNASTTWEIARFASSGGAAAVVNRIGNRQQMVWFMPFALNWAPSSNVLQHAWITWVTRGLFVGFRRLYLNTQVDDMFLATNIYGEDRTYRVTPEDMIMHIEWQDEVNNAMPDESEFFIEIGHNGNGDIATAIDTSAGAKICKPNTGIERSDTYTGPVDFVKPIGTGTNAWPASPENYVWTIECARTDALLEWFAVEDNRDAFAHVSHTFSHEILTNATYSDVVKETTFNQAWLNQVGLDVAKRFSPQGIIPPAITGLHNGDAIKAWLDNGITNAVGDNTRSALVNSVNSFWPLTTTVSTNGYAGLTIVPRWATLIYYNCDVPECTLNEWIDTSGGKGSFETLLNETRDTAIRNLMGLHWDAYMFHQANMRVHDVSTSTVGTKQGQFSLLMSWIEVVTGELIRLTTWPIRTLKHDDLAQAFKDRQTRDLCRPSMTWTTSESGDRIQFVNVYTTGGNKCGTAIPITIPSQVTSSTGATKEQIGTDPVTLWVTMSGASRRYTFQQPIGI